MAAKKKKFAQIIYEAEDILSTDYIYEVATQCVEAAWFTLKKKEGGRTPKRYRDFPPEVKDKLVLLAAKKMSAVYHRDFVDREDGYSIASFVLATDYIIENDM